mgnify:CR=1 FL=1
MNTLERSIVHMDLDTFFCVLRTIDGQRTGRETHFNWRNFR